MFALILGEVLWRISTWCQIGQRALGYRRYDNKVVTLEDIREL